MKSISGAQQADYASHKPYTMNTTTGIGYHGVFTRDQLAWINTFLQLEF